MSKKKRHKAKPKRIPAGKVRSIEVAKDKSYGRREIARDILKGVLFIAIAFAIKLAIEHREIGKQMQRMSYNLLQMQLSSAPPPITIVDISDLPSYDFRKKVSATPREPLKELLTVIAEQRPKAIGIDIDFSPIEDGYVHPDDQEFFEFCLELQKKTGAAVFLGIHRTIAKAPDQWLGDKKYESLAANILIPKDNKRMLSLMEVHDESPSLSAPEQSKPSRSMSELLAGAYGVGDIPATGNWLHSVLTSLGFIERFFHTDVNGQLSVQDFPIDYGALGLIEVVRGTIAVDEGTADITVSKDLIRDKSLAGRIVLIGDAALGKATDTFVVPNSDEPYPGVFVHASGVYTLIKAPLYDLTHGGHVALDILLSGLILLGVVLIKSRYKEAETREVAAEKWQGRLILLIVFTSIIVGVVFVRMTRILWDDFFLALMLLVFHPSIEHQGVTLWTWIRRRILPSKAMPFHKKRATSLKTSCLLLISTAILILLCSPGVLSQQPPAAAIIEKISGAVILDHNGKQITLNPKTDIARRLFAGDRLYCKKGAKLTLRTGKKPTELDGNSNWFTISAPRSSRSETAIQTALAAYGRVGGRNRRTHGKSILFSPADDSVVVPELFTVRWVPTRKNCVAAIEMQGPDGEILWEAKNLDGASGKQDAEAARQALRTYRKGNQTGSVRLKLTDSCGTASHSDFTVLSAEDENSLHEELRVWDSEHETLIKHLGRASVFSQYQMYSHVADEYEQALALAPTSRDLLLRTIEAQRLIGNMKRAKELERRLKNN